MFRNILFETDGHSPGKVEDYVVAHLPSLLLQVTEKILDFSDPSRLIPCQSLTKVHSHLDGNLDSHFLQISHWLQSTLVPQLLWQFPQFL